MDPNANLAAQELLIINRNAYGWRSGDRTRLRELREALNTWLAAGGFEPNWAEYPNAARWFGHAPDKRACIDLAESLIQLSRVRRLDYRSAVDQALAEYGDGNGVLISGVVRDHFPNAVKDLLRERIREYQDLADRSFEAWRLAGRRPHTWRRMASKFD